MNQFYQEIRDNSRNLSAEEELVLIRKAKEGCQISRKTLIVCNARYVIQKARERRIDVATEDLIACGLNGINRAIDKFKEEKGVRFVNCFRWYVAKEFSDYLKTHLKQIRLPYNKLEEISKNKRETSDFSSTVPWDYDLSYSDVSTEQVEFEIETTKQRVDSILKCLNTKQRKIVNMRLGINGEDKKTYKEIAKIYGKTTSIARYHFIEAINILKEFHGTDKIIDILA